MPAKFHAVMPENAGLLSAIVGRLTSIAQDVTDKTNGPSFLYHIKIRISYETQSVKMNQHRLYSKTIYVF